MDDAHGRWRRCSSCKNDIGFGTQYYVCSVSTCTQKRTGLVFCSVSCCEAHVSVMNHRSWGALDRTAPTRAAFEREQRASESRSRPPPDLRHEREASAARQTTADSARDDAPAPSPNVLSPVATNEILVVGSKLKQYVRDRGGLSTSDAVLGVLSDRLRTLCDRAIRNARRDGRKTVLDRDIT